VLPVFALLALNQLGLHSLLMIKSYANHLYLSSFDWRTLVKPLRAIIGAMIVFNSGGNEMQAGQKLTLKIRLKICWNVLTYTIGHGYPAQVKGLDLFQVGYAAGFYDAMPKLKPSESIVNTDGVT